MSLASIRNHLYTVPGLIPATRARFIHHAHKPWRRPPSQILQGRCTLWHTLWSDVYSNPRYAELVPRLDTLFFAPIRQRDGILGRVDGAIVRRTRFIEERTLEWYRRCGLHVLLTPTPKQAALFRGPVVVDLDDPSPTADERAAFRAGNIRSVIVTTNAIGRYVQESNPDLDVTVIPQGVDLERAFNARHEHTRRAILSRLSLPLDTVIVGYHAPIICISSDTKSQANIPRTFYADVLISAIQRLWLDGLSFVVLLVGKPSRAICELARSEPRLVLSGYVERDQLFDWVGAFDIGTYPRTIDFHGRESVKLLEYMANSAAVLAMRTSETTFLDKTASGLLANDANEFYERLRRLIIDRDERDGLTSRGRTIVKDRDWNKLAAHYDCLLAAFAEAA